ncbi:DUF2752 domain-containing protein [Rudaeicoccus suwonensis]
MYAATGLYCPACGATRSVYALLRGDFTAALVYNAALIASIFLIGTRALLMLCGYDRSVRKIDQLVGSWSIQSWAAIAVCWTIVRNLSIMHGILRP